jgi:threonine/homoserine/homoserine lactone efflux protein
LSLSLYLAFLAASTLLMLIPGPNVSLIVANSLAHGTRFGLLTVAATASAMVLQLGVTALGMTALLAGVAPWFAWLRWLGVAYLIWLGVRQWQAPPVDLTRVGPRPRREIFLRGFLVSLTNPKVLFFYGAFFPQFLQPGRAVLPQLALLGASFLAVALLVDGGWAVLAGRLRPLLAGHGRLRNRISGGVLVGAGVGLALRR